MLVELFTSEGCSSCPPADALLKQVNETKTSNGQLIVGVSEHVTYWNGLGWKDPYSLPASTDRQNAYAEHFRLEGVYTPQMVINGSEQIVGSDRAALARALQKEGEQPTPISLHILATMVAGENVTVDYAASGACRTRSRPRSRSLQMTQTNRRAARRELRADISARRRGAIICSCSHGADRRQAFRADQAACVLPASAKASPDLVRADSRERARTGYGDQALVDRKSTLHVGVAGPHIFIERGLGQRERFLQPFPELGFARHQGRGSRGKLLVLSQRHHTGCGKGRRHAG